MDQLRSYLYRHRWFCLYLALMLLAIFVRFFKLPALFHWTLDEEFWSYLPLQVAAGKNLPLIGGHIGGTGVYSGPLFVWLMGLAFAVSRHPLWIATVVSSIGVLSVAAMAGLFREIVGKKGAYVAALMYATSTLATLYDRKYWNASVASFLSIICVWLVYQIKIKPTLVKIVGLSFSISLAFHAHMTGLVLVIFAFISLLWYGVDRRWILYLFLSFSIWQIPLVVFELRHDWYNSRALMQLLVQDNNPSTETINVTQPFVLTLHTFSRLIFMPAQNIADELTLCPSMATSRTIPQVSFQFLAVGVLLFSLWQLARKNIFALLLWINIALVVVYQLISPENFYPGQLSEYYFLPAFASFCVLATQALFGVAKRGPMVAWGVAIFIVIVNLHITFNLEHTHGWLYKRGLVSQALSQVIDQPYQLRVIGQECQIYGYHYFLDVVVNKPPSESYVDNTLGWLYLHQAQSQPEVTLVIDVDSATIALEPIENN